MKRFLLLALVTCGLHATAAPPAAKESPPQRTARIGKVMADALHEGQITRAQYRQSMAWLHANPCSGVDRRLAGEDKARLEAGIARQQRRDKIRVFELFKLRGWTIVFSDAGEGDEPYFVYSADPAAGATPLTAWSGAATIFETTDTARWMQKVAPGIPVKLANCFAWHVTLDERSME